MSRKVPTATKRATGNPGKRKIPDNEVNPEQPAIDELAPPRSLSTKGRKVWVNIVEHLHRCGLYTVADQNTLASYCEAFAEWQHAQRMVWKYGHVVGRDPDGKLVKFEGRHNIETFPRVNPWAKISNDAFNRMTKLVPALGLSPAARAGLTTVVPPKAPGAGEFDEFDDGD